ncbi:efflux RND transporter periplasmic adaptor subunit [Termitidicoccus mucosus]|uniref:Efflux transporter periplasmic adaptor subunit n=1 Tax=Termitidicoccus mucosus TaxID=1184151 RepID=A0A178IJB0_9BACT|nr:efflux transporter periplasmic adaptor subunit [Opitutaceae bacterium TSB47]
MKKTTTQRGIRAAISVVSILAAGAAMLGFSGCGKKGAPQGGGSAPVTAVGVVTLKAQPVTLRKKLPGRTSAFRVAEVRARVNGIVLKRLFTEGEVVQEGRQLYQIDPAPYEAALASARATLARSEANLVSAKAQAGRYAELARDKAISQQDYDNAVAQAKAFEADVAAGKAAVVNAEINLAYTKVYAPISGRIGKSEVTEGAYVQAGAATLMAVVQQIDPIYVDIVQPAGQVLKLEEDRKKGTLQISPEDAARVKLFFHDGREYKLEGKLQFTDITVEQSTSSILLRAEFPNPNKDGGGVPDLLPGLFVRAEIVEGVSPNAVLVPQQGVSRSMKGDPTALVVVKNDQGQDITELRILKTERTIADHWLVTDGLKAGEQVVVENLQRVRQGMPVKPVPAGQSIGSLPITEPKTAAE